MVRVGTTPAVARAAWYDRNPTNYAYAYFGIVAPHGATQRISYTVPSGKKAIVELLETYIKRVTAATAPDTAQAYWQGTLTGATNLLQNVELLSIENTPAQGMSKNMGATITVNAGEFLTLYTVDASTGGTIRYGSSIKLSVFDA